MALGPEPLGPVPLAVPLATVIAAFDREVPLPTPVPVLVLLLPPPPPAPLAPLLVCEWDISSEQEPIACQSDNN